MAHLSTCIIITGLCVRGKRRGAGTDNACVLVHAQSCLGGKVSRVCMCVCVCELEAPAVLQQEAPVSGRLLGAASVDMRV